MVSTVEGSIIVTVNKSVTIKEPLIKDNWRAFVVFSLKTVKSLSECRPSKSSDRPTVSAHLVKLIKILIGAVSLGRKTQK